MMLSEYFTPVTGLAGGSLIGLSAATLLLFNGDILGASGLLTSVFVTPWKTLQDPSECWKLVLVSSFLFTSTYLLGPEFIADNRSASDQHIPIPSGFAYAVGGALVGFGTRLGNGCTSGHGICGMARFSLRSTLAVLTFMASAVVTVELTGPDSTYSSFTEFLRTNEGLAPDGDLGAKFTTIVIAFIFLGSLTRQKGMNSVDKSKLYAALLSGALFSAGLAISKMVLGSKLFAFLNVGTIASGEWDPTLAMVMGAGIPVNAIAYLFVKDHGITLHKKALSSPVCAPTFSVPTNSIIDVDLILGAAIFGVGWGLALLCPGPALYHAAAGNPSVLFRWLPAFLVGAAAAMKAKARHHVKSS